jgi:hypothetical protein
MKQTMKRNLLTLAAVGALIDEPFLSNLWLTLYVNNRESALHQLWKPPVFSSLAVTTLALGIGMNAIFILLIPMAVVLLITCTNVVNAFSDCENLSDFLLQPSDSLLDSDLVGPQRLWRRLMRALLAVILIVMLACASSARAQTSQPPHKPSSELQKEGDYYVGNWKLSGETKKSPFGPGGEKFESSERLEWMPGGFFLLARSYEGEKWTGLTIIGYDEKKKILTHTAYNARGEIELMEGTEQGDTEIWSGDGSVSGKPVRQRLTIKRVSPTLYTFKYEIAAQRGDWSLVYEGQGTKEQ